MRIVHYARSAAEAHNLRILLQSHGIEAVVSDEIVASLRGHVPMDLSSAVKVWVVDDARAEEAERILAARGVPASAAPWVCPFCDEQNPGAFDLCWSCGAERGP